jgi:hypothetical protein
MDPKCRARLVVHPFVPKFSMKHFCIFAYVTKYLCCFWTSYNGILAMQSPEKKIRLIVPAKVFLKGNDSTECFTSGSSFFFSLAD